MQSAFFGISMLYFLSFVPPGIVYLACVVLLWGKPTLERLFGSFEWGAATGLGLIVVFGFFITPLGYIVEIYVYRKFIAKYLYKKFLAKDNDTCQRMTEAYEKISGIIVEAQALRIGTEFVYSTWGWFIAHFNIFIGLVIILVVYYFDGFFVSRTLTLTTHATSLDWRGMLVTLVMVLHGSVAWILDKERNETFQRLSSAVDQAKAKKEVTVTQSMGPRD
jgi:hypothetical protein